VDPLAQLKDIHLPEQIHNYPIAPGWWIALFISICLLIVAIRWLVNYRKTRAVRNRIIKAIDQSQSIEQSSQLLKLALLNYFPRQNTANLYGKSLTDFLIMQLPVNKQNQFKQLASFEFDVIYQVDTNLSVNTFNKPIHYWLTHALPPKQGGLHD